MMATWQTRWSTLLRCGAILSRSTRSGTATPATSARRQTSSHGPSVVPGLSMARRIRLPYRYRYCAICRGHYPDLRHRRPCRLLPVALRCANAARGSTQARVKPYLISMKNFFHLQPDVPLHGSLRQRDLTRIGFRPPPLRHRISRHLLHVFLVVFAYVFEVAEQV